MRTAALQLALLALLTVVPAPTAAQGGDEAEKLFRAVEERLAKVKSISLDFSIEADERGIQLGKMKGSLAFAAGDRARYELEGTAFGLDGKHLQISDGKRMQVTITQFRMTKREELLTPKNLSGA